MMELSIRNANFLCRIALAAAFALAVPACTAGTEDGGKKAAPAAAQAAGGKRVRPVSIWLPLEADHIHDPSSPGLQFLQQPREALSTLPRASEGDRVDWVRALREGYIQPRTNIHPETKINVIDLPIVMPKTAGMPAVLFPHRAHTEWLDCKNCHDRIFKPKRGANRITMFAILQGNYCGQCHGAVAFPLTQCRRCHSVPR